MSSTLRIALLTFAMILVVSVACADVVWSPAYNDTQPMTATPWDVTLSFPQFDPALGTLLEVKYTLVSALLGQGGIENQNEESGGSYSFTIRNRVTVDDPSSSQVINLAVESTQNGTLSAYDSTTDYDGASGDSFTNVTANATDSWLISSGLGAWIGVGTVNADTSARASFEVSGDVAGDAVAFVQNDGSASLTLEYKYDEIPEPGTLALLAFGIPALAAWRKRRKDA